MKAKKATAGQKYLRDYWGINVLDTCSRRAAAVVDRLIARERRKERERLWKLICKSADSLASLASFRDSIEIGEFMHDIREVFKPAKKPKPAKKGAKKR